MTTLPPAHSIRHRLARLRSQLRDELTRLKVGSSVAKIVRGKLLFADEAIDICDQELLAEEQGRAVLGVAVSAEPTGTGSIIQNWGKP